MRRIAIIFVLGFAVFMIGANTSLGAGRPAKLTIIARGADMEFRSLGLIPTSFTIPNGRSQTFKNLAPGRYVVVQAPPLSSSGLRIQCSDGVSANQYDLTNGSNLTCTFTQP